MKSKKQKWIYKCHTSSLADTGDYESYVQFTNGSDVLQTNGDDIEEEQLKEFCELMNLMPDLWSHNEDNLEFELSQSKNEIKELKEENESLRSQIDEYYEEIKSLTESYKIIKSKYYSEKRELERELTTYRTLVDDATDQINELKEENERLKKGVDRWKNEVGEWMERYYESEHEINNLLVENEKLKKEGRQLGFLDYESVSNKLTEANQRIHELEEKVEERENPVGCFCHNSYYNQHDRDCPNHKGYEY